MDNMLSLRRVRRLLRVWRDSKQVCQLCDRRLLSDEQVCEAEACQMQALEAQSMLAPATLRRPAAKRRMPLRASALPVIPVFNGVSAF